MQVAQSSNLLRGPDTSPDSPGRPPHRYVPIDFPLIHSYRAVPADMTQCTCPAPLPVIGTIGTGLASLLFAVIVPSAPYWAFGLPAAILCVFGADFVFSTGTLFVAKSCLPLEVIGPSQYTSDMHVTCYNGGHCALLVVLHTFMQGMTYITHLSFNLTHPPSVLDA